MQTLRRSINPGLRAALAAILTWSVAFGQQQPPPQNPPTSGGGVKFSTISQLVVENVIVKDKSGNLVEGLTAKDFTVTENGAPQNIAFFEFQKLADDVEPPPTAVPPIPAVPAVPEINKEKVAPVTANQIASETPGNLKY